MALLDRRRRYGKTKKPDYLRFTASVNTTFSLYMPAAANTNCVTSVSYSTDEGETWVTTNNSNTTFTITTPTILAGKSVLWKGIASNYGTTSSSRTCYFSSTGNFVASGNIMSMIYGDDFEGVKTLSGKGNYTFAHLFNGCKYMLDAENIKLPATTLMPACYYGLFTGCTSITKAPELPAYTLQTSCYNSMFSNCTSLSTAPVLRSSQMVSNCYQNMFYGCTSLTTAPSLNATYLANYCYQQMFYGCTSLTTVQATLPATTLYSQCYAAMFRDCTNLTTAPSLPATTLSSGCYSYMFYGCSNLTTAPILSATSLVSNCYSYMFYKCLSLKYIKALFTTTPSTNYTNNWVNMVAYSGTFVKNSAATWNVTGVSGIPSRWAVRTASS